MNRWWTTRRKVWGIAVAFVLVVSVAYGVYLFSGLPSLERIENPKSELATKVYSARRRGAGPVLHQEPLASGFAGNSETVINALIATEDKDFYDHWGVDLVRFMKAMVKNVFALRLKEGASTITQQLSRSLYLGHNDRNVFDTVTRKIREFLTAIQLERTFTKDEILEFYLNVVYFGRGAYGMQRLPRSISASSLPT